jgi:hypothetical protein
MVRWHSEWVQVVSAPCLAPRAEVTALLDMMAARENLRTASPRDIDRATEVLRLAIIAWAEESGVYLDECRACDNRRDADESRCDSLRDR